MDQEHSPPVPTRRRGRGFTLIELMIVVAIIGIIAAIAIPSLLRSRISSNEASAIASLRALITAEEQYKSTEGGGLRYATLAELHSASPPFIDSVLSSGVKSGYNFLFLDWSAGGGGGAATFEFPPGTCPDWQTGVDYGFAAQPVVDAKTGNRRFCTDASGVVRYSTSQITWDFNDCRFETFDPAQGEGSGEPLAPIE